MLSDAIMLIIYVRSIIDYRRKGNVDQGGVVWSFASQHMENQWRDLDRRERKNCLCQKWINGEQIYKCLVFFSQTNNGQYRMFTWQSNSKNPENRRQM